MCVLVFARDKPQARVSSARLGMGKGLSAGIIYTHEGSRSARRRGADAGAVIFGLLLFKLLKEGAEKEEGNLKLIVMPRELKLNNAYLSDNPRRSGVRIFARCRARPRRRNRNLGYVWSKYDYADSEASDDRAGCERRQHVCSYQITGAQPQRRSMREARI